MLVFKVVGSTRFGTRFGDKVTRVFRVTFSIQSRMSSLFFSNPRLAGVSLSNRWEFPLH